MLIEPFPIFSESLYAVYRFTVTYFKTPYAMLGAPPQCLASARRKPGQQQTWGATHLVIFKHSYRKLQFIVHLPINNGDFP